MKMSIVKLKKEGKEETEEFNALMKKLVKTIEAAKENKARRRQAAQGEREDMFIRSDLNWTKFFEFIRYKKNGNYI